MELHQQDEADAMNDWTFDNLDFDKHVREQLPWYDLVTEAVVFMARQYLPTSGGLIYDIGASTGNITKAMADLMSARSAGAVSIEPNASLVKKFAGVGRVIESNAEDYDYKQFDIAILFLTLMFVPVSRRESLITTLKQNMRKGGAIIIVDKVTDSSGYFATCIKRMTMYFKQKFVTPEEIVVKEISLSGVQRPVKREGKLFFKFGEFEGWVIEADE
jgi:tRNA (cmo5U34)-methyltransferase